MQNWPNRVEMGIAFCGEMDLVVRLDGKQVVLLSTNGIVIVLAKLC